MEVQGTQRHQFEKGYFTLSPVLFFYLSIIKFCFSNSLTTLPEIPTYRFENIEILFLQWAPWKGGKKTDKLFSNSRMPFRENWKKNIREKPKKKKKKIVGLAMVEKWRVSRSARHWASSVLSCYDRNHYKCDRFIYKDSLLYSKYIYSSIPYFEPGCGSRWKKN